MSNVNIKEVEGGEASSISDTDAIEIDTGSGSFYALVSLVKSTLKTYFDTLYQKSVLVQRVEATPYTGTTAITTAFPLDDTIPEITDGGQVNSVTITPTSATNRLVIRGVFRGASNTAASTFAGLFQVGVTNALIAGGETVGADGLASIPLEHEMAAGTTAAITFTLRAGNNSGATTYPNGNSGGRKFGGKMA